jgi:hypothetical protein
MARPSKQQRMLQAKEAKQKKLLYVLIPVFLALAAFQGPKMYKAVFSSPAAPDAAAAAPLPLPSPTTTEATDDPAPAGGLPDTNVPPVGGVDRLVGFSRFTARDPFARSGGPGSASDDSDEQAATSAVIEVNGTAETVAVGGNFPSADPTFRLVSLGDGTANVGLVTGSFDNGDSVVELALGTALELVADPDGTHYTVKLVSVG